MAPGKRRRHGHSHVADGERRVENDVKWETDLKEFRVMGQLASLSVSDVDDS